MASFRGVYAHAELARLLYPRSIAPSADVM